MAKYRKRPLEIEAVEILKVLGDKNDCEIAVSGVSGDAEWFKEAMAKGVGEVGGLWVLHNSLCVGTLEGTMRANPGDFIVKGVIGEIYPVKREVFEQTYENVGK